MTLKKILKEWIIRAGFTVVSDLVYNHCANYYLHIKKGKIPGILNLKNPKTFNEKILYEKLYNRFPEGHLLADKYEVRQFIINTIGPKYLIPIVGTFDDVEKINFAHFPEKFVMKATQGSGWNIIVKDKNKLLKLEAKKTLKKWLKKDYSIYGREWQYENIHNRIIVEEFLENDENNPLLDYKFFCFNGEPEFVQVDIDREINHTRNFYDLKWNLQPFSVLYPRSLREIPVPENFEEMVKVAKLISHTLADKMNFVRVDLYSHEGKIYFGELTFHPGGGCEPFFPRQYDLKLGNMLKI